jgi:protein-S-isoprenylcysteine O-methyltransferase Ste14
MSINKRVVRGSVAIFYSLIGLEIIIMISPFAAYFYGVYGPLLNFLYEYKITAWLAGFFLPHAVISRSTLLNFLNGFGRTLFSLGLILFLIGALQIYTAKLRRKRMVTSVLYRWIRHPQYLFLAIAGLGLLLFWPRFIILVLYVSMLFVYYLLARYEEQRMLAEHGDSYRDYMQRTVMFLPGEPGGKIFTALFGWIKSPGRALAASYGVVLLVSLPIAFGLRSYTISQTSIVYLPEKQVTAISIFPQSDRSLQHILDDTYQQSAVTDVLTSFRQEGHKGFLVHVMPTNYMMQGLFVQPSESEMRPMRRLSWRAIIGFVLPFLTSHGHQPMMGEMKDEKVRLIFSQLTWPNGEYAPPDRALNFTVKHLPLLKADIDTKTHSAPAVERTPRRNFWGQMPMPLL